MAVIADENYDIITDGGFTDSDFATGATNIFRNLLTKGPTDSWVFRKEPLSIYTMGLSWKVRNNIPGFVSCSNDERTGVSRSESNVLRIYSFDDDDVKNLLDMMNEAWFVMTNN